MPAREAAPRVIINADDFGMSRGINAGVARAYNEGVLTSTTALANCLRESDAVLLDSLTPSPRVADLKKPPLGVGLHLNLTQGVKLSDHDRDIVMFTKPTPQKGSVWQEHFGQFSRQSVAVEFFEQDKKFRKRLNRTPDHLDSHHSALSYMEDVYVAFGKDNNLPLRPTAIFSENPPGDMGEFVVDRTFPKRAREQGIKTVDSLSMQYFYHERNPEEAFIRDLAKVKPGETKEFMVHPSVDDEWGWWRTKDLKMLTSDKVIQAVQDLGIELTTYGQAAS